MAETINSQRDEARPSFYRRHRWLVWSLSVVVILLAALAVGAAIALRRAEPFLRGEIVAALSNHFHAKVELDSFHVSLVKGIEAEGKGLRIWPPTKLAQSEDQSSGNVSSADALSTPLIQLDEFHFHAPLHFKPGRPFVIRTVTLRGMKIDIPAVMRKKKKTAEKTEADNAEAATGPGNADSANAAPANPSAPAAAKANWLSFVVNKIECTDAELKLETDKPGKLPLVFAISRLTMTDISSHGSMAFDAELTNPRPVGTIYSKGSFGPWVSDDPASSAVSGDYKFAHADLSIFKGIAGILDSTGHYDGTLRDITVDGVTDTPDFSLTSFGNPLPLHTKFHAKVDGTNGDTWLLPVDATLGHSHFTAQGPIVRVGTVDAQGNPHESGRDIALKVNVDKARIEDFLTLAGKSKTPLLNGDVQVKTTMHIVPGKEPVEDRLALDGEFRLDQAEFTSDDVQGKLRQLSLRGLGRPGDLKKPDPEPVESAMSSKFKMADGAVTLEDLEYSVPGALIELNGSFGLKGGTLAFAGKARMQATVSQMVGGWKGFLLKPADRFFKKDGAGTEVPIHIDGTREHPQFGVDFGKLKHTSPEKPGDKPAETTPDTKTR